MVEPSALSRQLTLLHLNIRRSLLSIHDAKEIRSMSAVVSGLVGAACAVAISAMSQKLGKPVKANAEGWKVLRPGWLINGAIVGSSGMSAFFGYIWIFVGSSRSDAETQLLYALGLFLAFGLAAFYLMLLCHAQIVMWKGNQLKIEHRIGSTKAVSFGDISAVAKSDLLGLYRVVFKDGKSVRISKDMQGIEQLLAKLPRRQF